MFPCRFQMDNDGWISHDIIGVYIMMMFYLYDKVVAFFFAAIFIYSTSQSIAAANFTGLPWDSLTNFDA